MVARLRKAVESLGLPGPWIHEVSGSLYIWPRHYGHALSEGQPASRTHYVSLQGLDYLGEAATTQEG